MTFGLFGLPRANILVGPDQFVAEAKRILFGRVGIDMIAGPTDSLILADQMADPLIVATDLVSQAEHGYNSPVWLVTDHQPLAEEVMQLVPELIADLPQVNQENAQAAWRDYAEGSCAKIVMKWRPVRMNTHLNISPCRQRFGLVAGSVKKLWLSFLGRRNNGLLW